MDSATVASTSAPPAVPRHHMQWTMLAALGVVFGDLGTSPLYTLQTVVQSMDGHFSRGGVLGVLSLIIWTLIITISIKYCLFVMRADNRGEGGILALMSLIGANDSDHGVKLYTAMGLLGAALIYGDGVITPAISVLSALEGVNVATSAFKPYVMPMAVLILVALFMSQRFGTERIGQAFGPVMLLWFLVIGLLGLISIAHHPDVLAALDPAPCGALSRAFRRPRILCARRRISLHHRRRGAVCRHGAFREGRGTRLLVLHRLARAAPELRRSNGVAPRSGRGQR